MKLTYLSTQGNSLMQIRIYKKESFYLTLMVLLSCVSYLFIINALYEALIKLDTSAALLLLLLYSLLFIAFVFFSAVTMLGNLRGNSVEVSENNFPELFEILKSQSKKLELRTIPSMYIMEHGGFLNAFATKLLGRNYVVLYTQVLEAAYQEGMLTVSFIIGHELGHIKRKHVGGLLSKFIFPARFCPFLNVAYSRACEYTCDTIGYDLSPEGAQNGLLILAVGKNLYKKINVNEFIRNYTAKKGFVTWFVEIFSTHPHLVKRIARIGTLSTDVNLKS